MGQDFAKLLIGNYAALGLVAFVVIAVVVFYGAAFWQGRSISFWPPNIGAKPASGSSIPELDKSGILTDGIRTEQRKLHEAEVSGQGNVLPQGPPDQKLVTLGIRLLIEECQALLNEYQRLHFDDQEKTRLPLHIASWPDFHPTKPWTYAQVKLCSLYARMTALQDRTRRVWAEMGWKEKTPVLTLDQSAIMPEVLDGLRQQIEVMSPRVPDHVKNDSLVGYKK